MSTDSNQVDLELEEKELEKEPEKEKTRAELQFSLGELKIKSNNELGDIAQKMGIVGYSRKRKSELIFEILKKATESKGYIFSEGILEITIEGYGFLRTSDDFTVSENDVYVSPSQIKRFALSSGDKVAGQVRPPKEGKDIMPCFELKLLTMKIQSKPKRPFLKI